MANPIPFRRDLDFRYGASAALTPLIRRVIARNPGQFTLHGTGTYIVGHGRVAIIDPGPDLDAHVEALLHAVRGETVTHILITHTHADHSPATRALQAATGATTCGYGPHPAAAGSAGDRDFRPDITLTDNAVVAGAGWTIDAVHTPGHISNHLCFALREERALFSGDHVMGWSTSVITPPDGRMADYLASLRRLLPRDDRLYYPTHGGPIADPQAYVTHFIDHRQARELQIIDCIARGAATVPAMVALIYQDVPASLHEAAGRSVLAHLIHLHEQGRVGTDPDTGRYRLPGSLKRR